MAILALETSHVVQSWQCWKALFCYPFKQPTVLHSAIPAWVGMDQCTIKSLGLLKWDPMVQLAQVVWISLPSSQWCMYSHDFLSQTSGAEQAQVSFNVVENLKAKLPPSSLREAGCCIRTNSGLFLSLLCLTSLSWLERSFMPQSIKLTFEGHEF